MMAMTADSANGGGADGVNSPSQKKSLPWAQVVRGEPEAVNHVSTPSSSTSSPPPPAPEQQQSDNAAPPPVSAAAVVEATEGKPKTAVWKRPSLPNGAAESVMGAISWPALSESTKPYSKSAATLSIAADSSPKSVSDGSSSSSSQGPVTPQSRGGQEKSNSGQNHTVPARQRSMKKGGGGGGNNLSAGSSFAGGHLQNNFSNPPSPPPPPPSPFPRFHMHPNGFGNLVPAMPDQSPRAPPYRAKNWEPRAVGGFVPQPPAVNDHRHSSRRGNFGPRGDGPHQNNLGGRREHDRSHYGNARDNSMQRGSPRGYVRPPPPSAATFVQPQPMSPFNPIGYHDFVYVSAMPMEPYRVPFIASPMAPPFVMPVSESSLSAMLVHQIDYYFSDANLVKDEYLKSNMDNQGWVPITLIAGFNRVKSKTNNIQVILESLRTSTVVEIQDDKVRRRNDWMNWIPSSSRLQSDSSAPSSAGRDTLTTSIQRISLENAAANQNTVTAEPSSFSTDAPGRRSSETVSQQGAAGGTTSSS